MKVHQIGNLRVPWSTESELRVALEANGVEVVSHQEDEVDWATLAGKVKGADWVIWTTTHDYAPPNTYGAQRGFLAKVDAPVVSYHLDLFLGLDRADRVKSPFFATDLVVTADGHHVQEWVDLGINHVFFPPAASHLEAEPGTPRDEYRSPVAFIGSWRSYHQEHRHRFELVKWLQRNYRGECRFWPKQGQHAVRGSDLRDLIASTQVVIGDSCFCDRYRGYHSDRTPEVLMRHGYLVTPAIDGVTDGTFYTDGEHLRTWRPFDWEALRHQIDRSLASSDECREVAAKGQAHAFEHHSYRRRMSDLIALLRAEKLL